MGKLKKEPSKQVRIQILSVLLAGLLVLSGSRLIVFQVVEGSDYLEQTKTRQVSVYSVPSARGNILDRYGRVLAGSETSFQIIFDDAFIKKSELNQTIHGIAEIFRQSELVWNNLSPLQMQEGKYYFAEGMDAEAAKLKKLLKVEENATAAECFAALKEKYQINTERVLYSIPIRYQQGKYVFRQNKGRQVAELKSRLGLQKDATAQECMAVMLQNPHQFGIFNEREAFTVACVRYSMERKDFSRNNPYVFADDVSSEMVLQIEEQAYYFSGVTIREVPSRVYCNGDVASHLIGTIGPIYAEEYAQLKQQGYAMNDRVGKSGAESAMEDVLRGKNGKVQVTQDASGNVLETKTLQKAETGRDVTLTIDSLFQQKLQELLSGFVAQAKSGKYRSKGGAIVVLDVKTGEVIAAVNSANYTVEEYKTQYGELLKDEKNPLFNRAIDGLYRPGSSLKPMVAVAAMNEGMLSPKQKLICVSPYKYGFTCLRDHHSGPINVMQSLHWSCNTFYYRLGESLGIDLLGKYAAYMGLGEKTGLEIKQAKGRFASPETTASLGGIWNPEGDVMQAAIGQNETAVSPLQMACEAMTIANKGTRYETHIVHSLTDVHGKETVTQPAVASSFEIQDWVYQSVTEGMRRAASKVPAPNNLTNLGYGVAQKTGTAQTTSKNRVNNDFIGFLPIADPEIAISCIVEDCDTGTAALMRRIITLYYECRAIGEEISAE